MLAKVWKKALLAVCIIACIYNVMHKLVTRTSLEVQLKSVQNQSSLMEIWKSNNTKKTEESTKKENSSKTNKDNANVENGVLTDDDDNTIVVIY